MRRDLRRRRAREGNLATGLQTVPAGVVGVGDDAQHAGLRKTRPVSAPIRSRARAAAAAAVAAAQPPRCATAEEGAKRFAPRATPLVAGRQGESAHLPVTPEARAASSTDRPATTRPYGITPLVNRDGLVGAPRGTPPVVNSTQDGLVEGVSSRFPPSSSSSSAVRRPASAGARTVASVATRPIKNNMQPRTAVGSLKNR